MDTSNTKLEALRRRAEHVESTVGSPLPQEVINGIVKIAEKYPDYEFIILGAQGLDRKVRFFRNEKDNCIFLNERAEEFTFSDEAYPIKHNKMFVGIRFIHKNKQARVYARF